MLEQILYRLKENTGYLSGEEISRDLNISRAGIWKYIQELRKIGYDIVAVPHLGYQLKSSPDKLFAHEIKFNLKTKRIGKKIFYFNSIGSTMDEAFSQALKGEDDGTVICAETQTKGRGRLGRSWSSPKSKGIYFSVILRPKLPPSQVPQLTLMSAVAVAEAIKKVSGLDAQIKWPNDLLIDNKKLVGILTEMSADMDRIKFVIIGIGVNVNVNSGLPPHATSLKIKTNQNFSRVTMMKEILQSLEHWYHLFHKEGFDPVMHRWKDLSLTLGRFIKISDPGQTVQGEAIDIDSDGGLLIRSDSGLVVKKMTGDVVLIK